MKIQRSLITLLLLLGGAFTSHANPINGGNVTTLLGPNFFFDAAATGGGDFNLNQPNAAVFDRNFGILQVGASGTTITITGIGWASAGSAPLNDATFATVTVTYLGLDGTGGGGDDILIGSATDDYTYAGAAGEYAWTISPPLIGVIDGLNNKFRVVITPSNPTSNGSLSFKTSSGTTAATVKLSVTS